MISSLQICTGSLLSIWLFVWFTGPAGLYAQDCNARAIPPQSKFAAEGEILTLPRVAVRADNPMEMVMGISYTPEAAQRVGGEQALALQVDQAIEGANTLLETSGIRVKLVLGYLAESNGQSCESCAALSRQSRPDATVVIEETGLGYADIPISVSQALNGARLSFGVLNFKKNTLAHEVGHSLGLFHGSRELTDTTVPGIEPAGSVPAYGQGVVAVDQSGNAFHTIMSYGNEANTSVQSNLFSSPDLIYNGVPTGTNESNSVKAANFWATYVTVSGERNYPLPISLNVLNNGKETILSGRCLEEVAGAPSEGVLINLVHMAADGSLTDLPSSECDSTGSFLLTVEESLRGEFQATHTGINQQSGWVSPLWPELSLFGSIDQNTTLFYGVCYLEDGLTPNVGAEIELMQISDEGYSKVDSVICSASGEFSFELSGIHPGRYEAQIYGLAYSGIIDLESSAGSSPQASCAKKISKLKRKIKLSQGSVRKKLKKKLKLLKASC